MMRALRSCRRCAALALAGVLIATLGPAMATQAAAPATAFQTCLDSRYDGWVKGRVALVLNEEAEASNIDDPAVARWAVETLNACRAQAGGGDKVVEERFTKRVAQWREHIYDGVQRMRELVKPD